MSGSSKNANSNAALEQVKAQIAAGQAQLADQPQPVIPTSVPANLGGGAVNAVPAATGNMQQMMADQMAAGGYGTSDQIKAQLAGMYMPVAARAAGTVNAVHPSDPAPAAASGGVDPVAALKALAGRANGTTPSSFASSAMIQRYMQWPQGRKLVHDQWGPEVYQQALQARHDGRS